MYDIKQSSTQAPLLFYMTLAADHTSPATGLSPTVEIRKPGGSFASPAGAVSEIAHGWYQVAGNATDTNTLGPIALHATDASADDCDLVVAMIVAYNPQDGVRLGVTALPNAAAEAAGGLYTRGTGAGQIKQTNNGEIDANTAHINNVATTPVTTIKPVQGLTTADTIINYTGNTPQSGDAFTRLGAPSGPSVSADVATVGIGMAAIKVQTDKLAFTLANKVDANILAIAGDTNAPTNLKAGTLALIPGTCAAGSTTTSIVTNLTNATDDFYNGRLITFTSGALAGQTTSISDYTGATKTLTVVALTGAPANTDAFVIS